MVKKKEEIPPHIRQFRKEYQRYQIIYILVVLIAIVAIAAIGYFIDPFWCIMTTIFCIWSWLCYNYGEQEQCIDEWEYAYPKQGFREMFDSWKQDGKWFAVFVFIAYLFCKETIPTMFDR
ncbi:MAG: hypothetical protein IJ218_03625 [Alphaproteobacteria bacterium]|nr:hypothetical protein [Alphaproteobacteria bacterium]